jgi:hypothetical protein
MANADRYAQWIVDNQDKQGTPEFETIASAYRAARSEFQAAPIAPIKQAPFSLKDTALSGAQSAVGAAKSITEAFGAGNAPAEYLEDIQKDLGAKLSPERQAELQRRAQLEKEAAKSGKTLEEISAGLGGIKEAPITTIAQGIGSSLPTVALGIGAGALGVTLGAPVAIAAGVGIGVKYLIGALQGAGEVKGSVYDAVREGLEKQGMKPEDAKNKAREAQNYMGDNWGTIATAAGLGGVAGGTGLEKEILAKFSKPVAARIAAQAGKKAETGIIGAGIKEALPEGAQGGQEQYAVNKALQRAGIDTPTWSGVAGAAARDAAMGALTGSAVRPFTGRGTEEQATQKPAVTPDENGQLPLFSADQLPPNTYKPIEPVPEVTPPEAPGGPKGEQLDLGLEATRNYGDMVKELERLKVAEKTPDTEARIADLQQQLRDRDTYEVDRIRGEKVQSESDAAKAANFPALQKAPIIPRTQVDMFGDNLHVPEEVQRDLFGEPVRPDLGQTPTAELEGKQLPLGLRRNPEGQPTTFGQPEPTISSEDVMLTAIPLRTAAKWVEKNVVGKTRTQLRSMVDANPTLVEGKDPRSQLLQTLLASEVPAFKEAPSVKTTKAPAAKPPAQPRGGQPSVGVSGKPAGTRVVTPRPAPAAPATTPPAGPVGLGLVPSEQPAGKGSAAPVAQPNTLSLYDRLGAPQGPAKANAANEILSADDASLLKKMIVKTVEDGLKAGKTRQQIAAQLEALTKGGIKPSDFQRIHDYMTERGVKEGQPTKAASVATETAEEAAQRKADAEAMRKAMEAQDRNYAKGRSGQEFKVTPPASTKTAAAIKRTEEDEQADSYFNDVLDRVLNLASPFDIQPRKAEDKSPRIGKTEQAGTQGSLFPMSKDNAKREAQRKPTAEQPTETKAEKDERQMELAPRKKDVPEWSSSRDTVWSKTVYGDDEVALVRQHNTLGQYVYVARKPGGTIGTYDIDSERFDPGVFKEKWLTAEQIARLRKARSDAVFAESKKAAKHPEGPFAGAKGNVVGSDSVDPRYVGYLQALMQSMGLGDVRVFLVNPDDVHAPDAIDKYKLYGQYASVLTAGDTKNEEGSVRVYGPNKTDFYISFKSGMSENKSVEVISHELGHAIEQIAFNNASPETKAAIKKEYEAWLQSTKGKTGRELVQSLRNRETAETQMLSVTEGKKAEDMDAYWTLFTEWFADNTSRWASTSEKPISITEKFFSKVAQMMRDFVALITGRKYPPAASVAKFLDSMGPGSADTWLSRTGTGGTASPSIAPNEKAAYSVSYTAEQLIDSMGPLEAQQKSALKRLIEGFQTQGDVDNITKARTQVADVAATVESRLSKQFNGAVRDSLGKLNPMGLFRQAQDYSKLLLEYFQTGTLVKDANTGQYRSELNIASNAPAEVYDALTKWGAKNGYSFERATNLASRILEGVRLDEMRTANRTQGTDFVLHMKDADIDTLVAEYKADKDLQNLSTLMDKPRIALVDHMIRVGRLTPEEGKQWKDVVGYVPFDRIEDFAEKFNKVKKISGKGIAQVGKLPELVGSLNRPVGNVFDNYINTLGWMVGQITKTDATINTLRSLEDLGHAKFLGNTTQGKDNTVGAYVGGELQYFQLPTKYDVMAFKDLNPPKAKWLQGLGQFSNILRTTVTAMPPFALKQVTDDIQRAIMTSGVKNPLALVRMSLVNFPKLAFAELRGIQHPYVKEFGALGLTGEFDFQQGRPAASLLADLGYKPRGKFKELLHRLEGVTRASDLAVRKAIYDQTVKESGDALLAQTRAREFINFRRRGASDFVGAMVTTIPFFNAYIQGMDVLYRAASGADSSSSINRAEARKMFWNRAATVLALSTLYAMGKSDDDDYNEMDLRTRDGNWVLGNGVKLPVPTELGALFKVIPERVVEYMRRQGTPEEQEAFEAVRTAAAYIFEQYVGRTVPIPQAAKPLLEAWTNHSFLTGRELEGIHQKGMLPSMRRASGTSELAIAIADFAKNSVGVEVSPIMVDNALRGYLGSTAAMATMVTDGLLNPTRMDRPVHKWALVSNYAYDPIGTRRTSEFYDTREKVGRINNTLNDLAKTDINAAEKFYNEHKDELALASAVNSTLNQIEEARAYRKFLEGKEAAATMTQEERRAQLDEVRGYEVEMVRWLRDAKTQIRNMPQ